MPEAYARISHETRRHLKSELAGVGAVAQVLVQLVPSLWDPIVRRHLDPAVSVGLVVGLVVMYLTGLLVVA